MGPWIWFNLLFLHNGQMWYIDSFETLEKCQVELKEYEQQYPGSYYCLPHQVFKVQNEFHTRSES